MTRGLPLRCRLGECNVQRHGERAPARPSCGRRATRGGRAADAPCLRICNLPTFNMQRLPPCAYGCTTATSKCMPSSRGKCPPQ